MDALKDPSKIYRYSGGDYLSVTIEANNHKEYRKVPYIVTVDGNMYVRTGWTPSTGEVHFIHAKFTV